MSKMTATRNASAPFNDPSADAILRSADNVDFRIHRVILSLASPVFKDMFSLPRPAATTVDETRDGLPVIVLTESSNIIDLFLRILYPVNSPEVTHFADIRALLEVSRKYEMEAFAGSVYAGLVSYLNRDPVGVFALSLSYGLKDVAAKAAHRCLRLSVRDLDSPELKYIAADQYRRLLRYHFEASKLLSEALDKGDWYQVIGGIMERKSSDREIRCAHCWIPCDGRWIVRRFAHEYILRVRLAVQASLGMDDLMSKDIPPCTPMGYCTGCQRYGGNLELSVTANKNFAEFKQVVATAVKNALATIPPPVLR